MDQYLDEVLEVLEGKRKLSNLTTSNAKYS